MVFVHARYINSCDATTIPRKQRRYVTNTFASSREPGTGDRPLVRPGKTATYSVNCGERHCAAPCSRVASRMLRPVASQQHPPFSESHPLIKLHQIIFVLTFEIARGTWHQNWPAFFWVKIRRRCQHSDCAWRHRVAALRGV